MSIHFPVPFKKNDLIISPPKKKMQNIFWAQTKILTFVSIHDLHNGQGTQEEKHHLDVWRPYVTTHRLTQPSPLVESTPPIKQQQNKSLQKNQVLESEKKLS